MVYAWLASPSPHPNRKVVKKNFAVFGGQGSRDTRDIHEQVA